MATRKAAPRPEASRGPQPTQIVPVRVPVPLLTRLDAYVDRLRGEQPGLRITRSDVIRLLCERGLDAAAKGGDHAT